MKKKILSITLVIALVAIAAMGTLAYFTDTDNATNTFVTGGVNIQLIEQQRNAAGTDFEPFDQDKVLMPIVGSAQTDPKDDLGMTTAENYVDKVITVKNTGKSDAYIRLFVAIPADLDNAVPNFDASLNVLHFNFGNYKDENNEWHTTYQNQWNWKNEGTENQGWNFLTTTIGDDGITYNVYYAYYYQPLAPGAETVRAIHGLYLDKGVDYNDEGYMTITRNGQTEVVPGNWTKQMKIKMPVFVQAVQAAGFESAEAAFTASGLPTNPWA